LTDTDRILLNTEWIKVAAKHHGQKGKIDSLGPRGPRMRLLDTPVHARHGSNRGGQPMFIRLDWWELGNNWEPLHSSDTRQYNLWKDAVKIEELDRKLEKELESVGELMNELAAKEVACTSVYHKPKNGLVPEFSAYKTRNDNWVCLDCKSQREQYQRDHAAKMRATKEALRVSQNKIGTALEVAKKTEYIPPKLEIDPVVEVLPQWRITIVEPTVHIVSGRDFLEAAAQVSEKGEIIRVEKL